MKKYLVLASALAIASCQMPLRNATAQQSPQQTLRDASGRTIGTVTTDSQGTQVFRDAGGRTTGTSSIDSRGNTTFRDAGGRTTGTLSPPSGLRR